MPMRPLEGTRGWFLLRHGESAANVQGLIASSPANAGRAFGLTPAGREQVRRSVVDAHAAGVLPAASHVVSSPLLRARESAAIAAEVLGSVVRVDERLIERGFGDLELMSDEHYASVWRADRADPTHVECGVESVIAILGRASGLLRDLERDAPGATVLLCTHGDVASVLLCAATGQALNNHRDIGAMRNGEIRALAGAREFPRMPLTGASH
ncbi:MAG: histidine phosphatase family protein [Gemmatimonadales bacterium]